MAEATPKTGRRVVVALGGNAILQPGQVGTFEEQLFNIDQAMRRIAALVEDGWQVVLTHGNGPQVGNLLIQNALAAKTIAPMPMDVCGAMSQGQIGYMLEQSLQNHFNKRRLDVPIVTVMTQVAVDAKDKAFANPSKPVGPFYSEAEARKMMLEEGLAMREDAGRGWRRVVPSPQPKEIVPRQAVVDLVNDGLCVICSGGGGVPVVRRRGALSGIDAVIDKDLAAAVLAENVAADVLLILTDVPQAYVHYNTPEQRALATVTVSEMERYAGEGHFKAGSMGPKVDACLRFVRSGGVSIIGSLTQVVQDMHGEAGTRIVPDAAAKRAPARKGAAPPQARTAKSADARRTAPAAKAAKPSGTRTKPGGADVIDIHEARRASRGATS